MSARLTDQQRLYRAVTERQFQADIRALLATYGYRVHVVHDSRRSPEGWPDCLAASPNGDVLALELKTETGRVTVAQTEWLALLNGCGVEARVLRPSEVDWLIGRLQSPMRRAHAQPE